MDIESFRWFMSTVAQCFAAIAALLITFYIIQKDKLKNEASNIKRDIDGMYSIAHTFSFSPASNIMRDIEDRTNSINSYNANKRKAKKVYKMIKSNNTSLSKIYNSEEINKFKDNCSKYININIEVKRIRTIITYSIMNTFIPLVLLILDIFITKNIIITIIFVIAVIAISNIIIVNIILFINIYVRLDIT